MPAAKEKTFKCLNPVGIDNPVEPHPLAPLAVRCGKLLELNVLNLHPTQVVSNPMSGCFEPVFSACPIPIIQGVNTC